MTGPTPGDVVEMHVITGELAYRRYVMKGDTRGSAEPYLVSLSLEDPWWSRLRLLILGSGIHLAWPFWWPIEPTGCWTLSRESVSRGSKAHSGMIYFSTQDLPMPTEAQQPVFSLMSALIALARSSGQTPSSAKREEPSINTSSQLRASMSWVYLQKMGIKRLA